MVSGLHDSLLTAPHEDGTSSLLDCPAADNRSSARVAPRSLYVHIPFCPYKCPYCDFVTHVGSERLVEAYVDAVCQEIRGIEYKVSLPLRTVYFGGGTPSMLQPEQIEAILGAADERFGIEESAEISLEANPDAVDQQKLSGLRAAGVDRLSLGVQSLQPLELDVLGRRHTPHRVRQAFEWARDARFENVSIDLIYGTPGQTVESWRRTLSEVMDLGPEHLSMYSLIVEPGTWYGRMWANKTLALPEDDLVADMYDLACDMARMKGFVHYEVANWAQRNSECLHNLAYWRNHQFFAVGVGAHDYICPFRCVRVRGVQRYIDAIAHGSSVIERREHSGPLDERFETVIMGLRLLEEGVERAVYDRRFSERLDNRYGSEIEELKTLGLIEDDGSRIRIPESKVPLANEVWERFLPHPVVMAEGA